MGGDGVYLMPIVEPGCLDCASRSSAAIAGALALPPDDVRG